MGGLFLPKAYYDAGMVCFGKLLLLKREYTYVDIRFSPWLPRSVRFHFHAYIHPVHTFRRIYACEIRFGFALNEGLPKRRSGKGQLLATRKFPLPRKHTPKNTSIYSLLL